MLNRYQRSAVGIVAFASIFLGVMPLMYIGPNTTGLALSASLAMSAVNILLGLAGFIVWTNPQDRRVRPKRRNLLTFLAVCMGICATLLCTYFVLKGVVSWWVLFINIYLDLAISFLPIAEAE